MKKLLKIKRNTVAMCEFNLKIVENVKEDAHNELLRCQVEGDEFVFNEELLCQLEAIAQLLSHAKAKLQKYDTKLSPDRKSVV